MSNFTPNMLLKLVYIYIFIIFILFLEAQLGPQENEKKPSARSLVERVERTLIPNRKKRVENIGIQADRSELDKVLDSLISALADHAKIPLQKFSKKTKGKESYINEKRPASDISLLSAEELLFADPNMTAVPKKAKTSNLLFALPTSLPKAADLEANSNPNDSSTGVNSGAGVERLLNLLISKLDNKPDYISLAQQTCTSWFESQLSRGVNISFAKKMHIRKTLMDPINARVLAELTPLEVDSYFKYEFYPL